MNQTTRHLSLRDWLKRAAWRTPPGLQHALRKYHFMWQAMTGRLASGEPEHVLLPKLLSPGCWVIDVGANVGLYTLRMSELAGPAGRVIAFEPVASTFEILATNCRLARCHNVSLINAAASDHSGVVSMTVPHSADGSPNFYQAHIQQGGAGAHSALAVAIDSLALSERITLVKIDAEGHDAAVLRGMVRLLERDHPILIVESGGEPLAAWLSGFGYVPEHLAGSSNTIFRARNAT